MESLQNRLKQYRTEKKMTQIQISEILGMKYQEYQKIENGKTIIRVDKLAHICKTLGVSADWLLGLTTDGGGE